MDASDRPTRPTNPSDTPPAVGRYSSGRYAFAGLTRPSRPSQRRALGLGDGALALFAWRLQPKLGALGRVTREAAATLARHGEGAA